MPRIARLVVPGLPHHVTQRGNRRQKTFFNRKDYAVYRDWLAESCDRAKCEIWAYCLMPNHVHVIIVPSDEDGLRKTFADLHRRYTARINARLQITGYLWQGRYGSVVMDEDHLLDAIRYVSLNPVRAGLVQQAEEWAWSSVRAHLSGQDDGIVRVAPVLDRIGDFRAFLCQDFVEALAYGPLRRAEKVGRPVGGDNWLRALEERTGRTLRPQKRGRKPRL